MPSIPVRRLAPLALVGVLAVGGLAACSDDSTETAGGDPAAAGSVVESATVAPLSPAEGMELLAARDDIVLVDVRTPEEFAEGHIEGAVNINLQGPDFEGEIAELDPSATYVVYCRSGNRSATAAEIMADAGFTDVYDMGGIVDWESAGGEVVVPTEG